MSKDYKTNERIIVSSTPTPLYPYTPNQGFWNTNKKPTPVRTGDWGLGISKVLAYGKA
ncbi:hypothetical protein [Anabaena azotica]|uniref:hypothetical protein n=1 Tax=Anabaena azotica TaxID=197653 RepID=UPI0016850FCF|nr:hypothetical protein [Anabaena azotica]